MNAKLTLKLNKNVIRRAREYASAHNKSLSAIVESYLQALTDSDPAVGREIEISPFVKSMSGGINIPVDLDYKREYLSHLKEKYT